MNTIAFYLGAIMMVSLMVGGTASVVLWAMTKSRALTREVYWIATYAINKKAFKEWLATNPNLDRDWKIRKITGGPPQEVTPPTTPAAPEVKP